MHWEHEKPVGQCGLTDRFHCAYGAIAASFASDQQSFQPRLFLGTGE